MLVMAMLMIFGIMTYSKYTKFKSETILKAQFDNYMEFSERQYINLSAIKTYSKTHVNSNSTKNSKSEETKNTNTSKLPIFPLLEQETLYTNNQGSKFILKELIKNLYSSYDFYKKIQNERPDFIDEIIAALPDSKKNLLNNQKILKASDLANLDLKDSQLNDFFYSILKGAAIPYKTSDEILIEGYPSITSFLDVRKNKIMRIYLAPKQILEIVFNPSVADEVIQTREFFFHEIDKGRLNPNEATEKFQSMFKDQVKPIFVNESFDFNVTKTDPKKYAPNSSK